MTSKQAALCISFCMVLMALHAGAQQTPAEPAPAKPVPAQAGSESNACPPSPIESRQLPCQENRITIEWPMEIENSGQWMIRTEGGPWKNPWARFSAYDRQVVGGGCAKGLVDPADFFDIWKPGSYTFQLVGADGAIKIGPIHLEIMEPQGVDREVYEKLIIPRIPSLLRGQDLLSWVNGNMNLKDNPPIWSTILEKYPTSTYAGYLLAQNGVGFSNEPITWLDDPNENMLRYHTTPDGRVGQAYIDRAIADMAAFAKSAGPFLNAHPDFVKAPLLRRKYAMCLGLTGHIPEAMAQLHILAQGTGKEADEAKAFLSEKASRTQPSQALPGAGTPAKSPPATEQPKQ